jgi:signal transduction histidine kinase
MEPQGAVTEYSTDHAFALFEEASFGVLITDEALRIRMINEAARRLCAAHPAPLDLDGLAEVLAGDSSGESVVALFRRTLETGKPYRSAEALGNSGATRFDWEINRVPLEYGRHGVVCFVRPIAREPPNDQQAPSGVPASTNPVKPERTVSSRVKDEFLATVSHELRSPLQGILGWLTLLQDGRLDAAQTARALQSVERSVRLQAQLVNDIMDIARIETRRIEVERTPIDVAKLLRTTAEEYLPQARARQVTLDVGVKSSGLVLGDRERLHQVFANLLSNSLKFTPAGGSITLACDRERDQVVTTVIDTGHGIEAEFMPYMFKRFSQEDTSMTRRHAGLGLGLAIVRHLVELHGGTVTASSPGRDRGTTLIVRLPAAQIAADTGNLDMDGGAISRFDGVEILLVDDDADTLEAMKYALASLGARVRAATSVTEGWRAFADCVPDLVVTDLSMPEEDGYALLHKILGSGNRPPVVALTGLTRREDRERVLHAGFAAFVAKPIDLRELAVSLKLVLDRRVLGN